MPLFEFRCESCGKRFEEITRAGAGAACPGCGSAETRRLLSAFAVGRGGATASRQGPRCDAGVQPGGG